MIVRELLEPAHSHLKSRRSNVNRSRLDYFSLRSFAHGKRAKTVQPRGKRSGETSRHVLDNQDWNCKVSRKSREHFLQRFRASGRDPERNNRRSGARHRSRSRVCRTGRLPQEVDDVVSASTLQPP